MLKSRVTNNSRESTVDDGAAMTLDPERKSNGARGETDKPETESKTDQDQEKVARALPDWMKEKEATQEVHSLSSLHLRLRRRIKLSENDKRKSPHSRKQVKHHRVDLQREIGPLKKSMTQQTYQKVY